MWYLEAFLLPVYRSWICGRKWKVRDSSPIQRKNNNEAESLTISFTKSLHKSKIYIQLRNWWVYFWIRLTEHYRDDTWWCAWRGLYHSVGLHGKETHETAGSPHKSCHNFHHYMIHAHYTPLSLPYFRDQTPYTNQLFPCFTTPHCMFTTTGFINIGWKEN